MSHLPLDFTAICGFSDWQMTVSWCLCIWLSLYVCVMLCIIIKWSCTSFQQQQASLLCCVHSECHPWMLNCRQMQQQSNHFRLQVCGLQLRGTQYWFIHYDVFSCNKQLVCQCAGQPLCLDAIFFLFTIWFHRAKKLTSSAFCVFRSVVSRVCCNGNSSNLSVLLLCSCKSWLWSSVWSNCSVTCSRFWRPTRSTGNTSCASSPLF